SLSRDLHSFPTRRSSDLGPFAARFARLRFSRRYFFRTPKSFRGQLECPRQDQGNWKAENYCGDKHFHHPRRRLESGKENGGCLRSEEHTSDSSHLVISYA